ncbi:MAG: family 10 glycosylhydrolase [Phycisphaerae bacterium]|nr:family 10 glycosylhydrolase [Phycisphaerae bacterium]
MPVRSVGFKRSAVATAVFSVIGLWSSAVLGVEQFRAVWADAFHEGAKSTTQIDNLVNRLVAGHYNAVVVQVLPYHDRGSAHGAYWNSSIVPKATDISGGIDPLAYLCTRAHSKAIEVHCWLLPFRACTSWPPAGNSILAAHPEWMAVPRASIGAGPTTTSDGGSGAFYMLDPGSPDVQEYLISIVRELTARYPIDGISFDYVRYTVSDAGYPASTTYENSGLKRFQRITPFSGTPSTTDAQWNDFRRREIDELIRRCRAEIPSISTNPRQPVRFSASVFATGSAPGSPSSFSATAAYTKFQNWELWMRSGWLDMVLPMNYKEEHCGTEPTMYRSWVNAATSWWRYNRHAAIGQATYMNTFDNSVSQMQYAYDAGANGAVNYSYYATKATEAACNAGWKNDWSWYTHTAGGIYADAATTPTMTWRNSATATEGTLWGRVMNGDTGLPFDNASVTVGSSSTVHTDGNGYYVATLLPAVAAGTPYTVTATKPGTSVTIRKGALVKTGDVARCDLDFVTHTPFLAISPTTVSRTGRTGQTVTADTFEVWNDYAGEMPFTVVETQSWLDVSAASGTSLGPTDRKPITISYIEGVEPGHYSGQIVVQAVGSSNGQQTVTVNLDLFLPADYDQDDDVDMADFGVFQLCLSGSGVGPTDGCVAADLDEDNDVDNTDLRKFLNCLSGEGMPGVANCAD